MGEEFLAAAGRVLEDGSRHPTPLGEELTEKRHLLYGLSVVAARSLGMAPEVTAVELADTTPEAVEALARDWPPPGATTPTSPAIRASSCRSRGSATSGPTGR
jgi:hypothetical protein